MGAPKRCTRKRSSGPPCLSSFPVRSADSPARQPSTFRRRTCAPRRRPGWTCCSAGPRPSSPARRGWPARSPAAWPSAPQRPPGSRCSGRPAGWTAGLSGPPPELPWQRCSPAAGRAWRCSRPAWPHAVPGRPGCARCSRPGSPAASAGRCTGAGSRSTKEPRSTKVSRSLRTGTRRRIRTRRRAGESRADGSETHRRRQYRHQCAALHVVLRHVRFLSSGPLHRGATQRGSTRS